MREILFRGKRVDNGEWIQGYYLVAAGMSFMSIFGVMSPTVVIPETVGQYTGLKDKNGQKIFEGDIVYNGVFKTAVDFNNGWFYPFSQNELGTFYSDNSTVIGNIHDNPELLNAN